MGDTRDKSLDVTQLGAQTVLRVGEVFAGRYEVQSAIGAGGMGTVYRVLDRTLGEVVALKIMTLGGPGAALAVDRFRREVRVARKVTHKNVCRTFDVGEHEGVHYLTMEHVAGRSLDDVLGEGKPPTARAVEIAVDVATGLAAAHAAGIVHRDLKPANVLIDREGRVVLTDFGIARPISAEGDSSHTQGSVGTPTYMAPEQVHGGEVDARADLYAFGVMLYEMLTGTVPFEGPTPMAAAVARLLKDPPDPRTRADVPDALADLVLRCLAREPAGRPASAGDVKAELERFGGSTATAATTAPLEAAPPKPRVPTVAGERSMAVLPFRYRGPPEHEYLGQGLADELVDTLSRTRGMRVLASGATAKFADDRDARTVGKALGVDAIVDGTVTRADDRVRITARLVDVGTGLQAWSERFEGRVEDVLALEESMSRRIAEALRLELGTSGAAGTFPAEAVRLYFEGRRALRRFRVFGDDGAVALFERCLALAPGLRVALGARAIACVRAWFLPGLDGTRDWGAAAIESVAAAKAQADDIAETHLASAMFDVQSGRYPEAVVSLRRALEIAPTFPEAHEYLGNLQLEAGPAEEGVRRLRLAFDLDPSLSVVLSGIARFHALRGNMDEYDRTLEELKRHAPPSSIPIIQLDVRVGTWIGDLDRVKRGLEAIRDDSGPPSLYLQTLGRYVIGRLNAEEIDALFLDFLAAIPSPRFASAASQFIVEAHASRDRPDLAMRHLTRAAKSVLIDLEWMDRCPVLRDVRKQAAYGDARRLVLGRAEAIWRV